MVQQISQRESEFKKALQKAEREIMGSFAFKKEVTNGSKAHTTMSETITLDNDYVVMQYLTEFQGADLSHIEHKLRNINPTFSTEQAYMRDLQMTVDENYLNSILFNMFYNKKTYSLTEALLEMMPEDFVAGAPLVRALMNTSVFNFLFPELEKTYGKNQQLDFRCAFNKDFLEKGELKQSQLSQIYFREGNRIEADLHFGCTMYVYKSYDYGDDPMMQLMNLFNSLSFDHENPNWLKDHSFFVSMSTDVEFDFGPNAKRMNLPLTQFLGDFASILPLDELSPYEGLPIVVGKLLKFNPIIKELKVFDGDKELFNEADSLNNKIQNIREFKGNKEYKMLSDFMFGQGMPIAPFPDVEPCLGLEARDSTMTIKEGYAVLAFDYDVS